MRKHYLTPTFVLRMSMNVFLFITLFITNSYAQPPGRPTIPNDHNTDGALLDPGLIEPNTTGVLWTFVNNTTCNIAQIYSFFTVRLPDGTEHIVELPNPIVTSTSNNPQLDIEALYNYVFEVWRVNTFEVINMSLKLRINLNGTLYDIPAYPNQSRKIRTGLPSPCDCLYLDFVRVVVNGQISYNLVIQPGICN